jgi:hypothetical protein
LFKNVAGRSRDTLLASAIGAILRRECGGVILCADPDCKWSGFDGPERCPRCKGPVKPVRKEEEPEMSNKPTEQKATATIRDCGSYKSYHITYRGQTMRSDAWAAKLGIPEAALTVLIEQGRDITPLIRGPEPPPVAPIDNSDEKAKVDVTGVGKGRRYMITFRGKAMGVNAWIAETGCGRSNLLTRLAAGKDITYLLRGESRPRGPKPRVAPPPTPPAAAPLAQPLAASAVPANPAEDPTAVVKRVRDLLAEIDACDDAIAGAQEHLKELQDRKLKLIAQLPGG